MKIRLDHPVVIGLCLILPVLLFIPYLGGFFYNAGSPYTDMAISHYPNALWLQQSIQAFGQVPLWSPAILSGMPFAANPLSGLHYPSGWLALLFPLPFGLNLCMLLHLVFGGIGMFLFLRGERLDPAVALFGAIGYEAMPKLFSHLGAGHLSLIYAAAWGPWLLLAQQAAERNMRRFWMAPGLVLGMIFQADPRYAAIAGLVWAGYSFQRWIVRRDEFPQRKLWLAGTQAIGTVLLALGLGAVLLIPMLEYAGLSTRSLMTVKDLQTLSLPPMQIAGLFVPNLSGTAEWMLYPGAAVLSLALLALALPGKSSQKWFWGIFVLGALVWSLGEYVPGLSLLNRLPGLNMLRVPPRMMLAGFLALIVLACLGLQGMLADASALRRMRRLNPLLVLVGIDFLLVLLSGAIAAVNAEFPWHFAWGAAALAGTLLVLFMYRAGKITPGAFGILITAWLLADILGVNFLGMESRPAEKVLSEGRSVAATLLNHIPFVYFRVYSPSYSLPQQTAAYLRLELADGIDPLQLSAYSQFMERATGVPANGYSVTMPPFNNGDPTVDNAAYLPDPHQLGLLNVRYVVSEFPLHVQGLSPVGQESSTFIYRNEFELPRAWVQDPTAGPGEGARAVTALVQTPNHIEIRAQGPGLLVVSEVVYPGWKARIDDVDAVIQPVAGLLRGVMLTDGEHLVQMEFRPVGLFIGLGISLATLLVCLIAFVTSRRQAV